MQALSDWPLINDCRFFPADLGLCCPVLNRYITILIKLAPDTFQIIDIRLQWIPDYIVADTPTWAIQLVNCLTNWVGKTLQEIKPDINALPIEPSSHRLLLQAFIAEA